MDISIDVSEVRETPRSTFLFLNSGIFLFVFFSSSLFFLSQFKKERPVDDETIGDESVSTIRTDIQHTGSSEAGSSFPSRIRGGVGGGRGGAAWGSGVLSRSHVDEALLQEEIQAPSSNATPIPRSTAPTPLHFTASHNMDLKGSRSSELERSDIGKSPDYIPAVVRSPPVARISARSNVVPLTGSINELEVSQSGLERSDVGVVPKSPDAKPITTSSSKAKMRTSRHAEGAGDDIPSKRGPKPISGSPSFHRNRTSGGGGGGGSTVEVAEGFVRRPDGIIVRRPSQPVTIRSGKVVVFIDSF